MTLLTALVVCPAESSRLPAFQTLHAFEATQDTRVIMILASRAPITIHTKRRERDMEGL